jgi:hypothetical protein
MLNDIATLEKSVIAPLKLKTILPYDLAILPQAYTQSN